MTRVLLIADTQRVQRIFHYMAEQGLLQLQTASTLALGEFELSAFSPDITFVQSRISGFSGDILLRHLDKMLPPGGLLVLLAGDSEDAAQAKRHGRTSLDLAMDDALLEQSVAALLTGEPLLEVPVPEEPEAAKAAAKPKKATTATARQEPPVEAAAVTPAAFPAAKAKEHLAPAELGREDAEAAPVAEVAFQSLPIEPAAADVYPAAPVSGKSAVSAFEDVMKQAEARTAPMDEALSEVADRVEVRRAVPGKELLEEVLAAPPTLDGGAKVGGGDYAGETVADALRRAERTKRRRPWLFIVPVLVLIGIPLVSYLAGRSSVPEEAAKQAAKPALRPGPAPAAPVVPAVPTTPTVPAAPAVPAVPSVTVPPRVPAAAPAPSPAPQSAVAPTKGGAAPAAPAAPAAKPQVPAGAKQAGETRPKGATRGVENLPAMLEGTKVDAEYGKKHPGWVRYLGIRAEYKLFRENNVYRAMQVIPVSGGSISDDLFKRVLRQFGGADSYRVESSAGKGAYLVEQCATTGPASLTIYRGKTDKKMKALVVYYP
ncbi:hypothetical protein [Geomonas azotofigens]|uniref:hypothetical protein n=1 Tax=Geomonas azotofigens TaxID=2843196 RepID=UPI001C0F449A|nr:hypothetical protein [Geomonas azotofigens]MBU5612006.1 hypothetical protein [Geomonas azotofigens]